MPFQTTVDCHGVGGFDQVEKVVSSLLSLLDACQAEERRQITVAEARALDTLVQGLHPFDRKTKFKPRAKHAKSTGRFKKKKGAGSPEVETSAK